MLNWNLDLQATHPLRPSVTYAVSPMKSGSWLAMLNRTRLLKGSLPDCLEACQQNANNSTSRAGLGEHIVDMMEDLRERIRPAREAAGLTQTEAGKLIGSKMQYWSDIERGHRTATLEQLIRIVNALGLEVSLVVKQKPSRRKSA